MSEILNLFGSVHSDVRLQFQGTCGGGGGLEGTEWAACSLQIRAGGLESTNLTNSSDSHFSIHQEYGWSVMRSRMGYVLFSRVFSF